MSFSGISPREQERMSDGILLTLSGVSVVYLNIILALRSVSFSVPNGSMIALLGANGAGKTTTLKAISNSAQPRARQGYRG